MLYPGLGTGNLFEAVQRYCMRGEGYVPSFGYDPPNDIVYEIDPGLVHQFEQTHTAADLDRDVSGVSRKLDRLSTNDIVEFDTNGRRKIPRLKHEAVVVEPIA